MTNYLVVAERRQPEPPQSLATVVSASTPEARAAIAARRLAGESYAAIGHTYGVSRERIRQICTQLGVTSPVDLRRVPEARIEQAVALIKEGASPHASPSRSPSR